MIFWPPWYRLAMYDFLCMLFWPPWYRLAMYAFLCMLFEHHDTGWLCMLFYVYFFDHHDWLCMLFWPPWYRLAMYDFLCMIFWPPWYRLATTEVWTSPSVLLCNLSWVKFKRHLMDYHDISLPWLRYGRLLQCRCNSSWVYFSYTQKSGDP